MNRVRENTSELLNQRIDQEIAARAIGVGDRERRAEALDREWSLERVLEAEVATNALLGLALGTLVHPAFLAQTGLAASMLWLHGVQGWYPLLGLFRKAGLRTRGEILREKHWLLQPKTPEQALDVMGSDSDRVRRHTDETLLRQSDAETSQRVRELIAQGPEAVRARIVELQTEWDIERVLQVNASTLALTGLVLSQRDRRWLAVPATVFSFFLQHAVQGWCPPIPLLRRLGVRTRSEIDRELYALLAATA